MGEPVSGVTLDASQQAAVELSTGAHDHESRLVVITGGPGTGKTTTLRVILDVLEARGVSVALASPTGKAAKRMTEATGRDAATIHRLLQWSRDGFLRNENYPLDAQVTVIDEASMLDVELGASLFRAIRKGHTLILVGDKDQLPPVGPGCVFRNAMEIDGVPVARLTTLHRAAQDSWVCRNAPNIIAGKAIELDGDFHDFDIVEVDDAPDIPAELCKLAGGIDQVLSPQRTGSAGIDAINTVMQATLNPPAEGKYEWRGKSLTLRAGDPVINTRNDYELLVMNGECGVVLGRAVNDYGEAINGVRVRFDDGREVNVPPFNVASNLRLAYGITIHKSQGSEWPRVAVVCHTSHSHLLSRNLLYTAVTRAKAAVTLVGSRAAIARAISKQTDMSRNSSLVQRVHGEEEFAA